MYGTVDISTVEIWTDKIWTVKIRKVKIWNACPNAYKRQNLEKRFGGLNTPERVYLCTSSFRSNFVQPLNFQLPFLSLSYPTAPLPFYPPPSPFSLPFPPPFLLLSFPLTPSPSLSHLPSFFLFLPTHSPLLPPSPSPLLIPYLPFNSLLPSSSSLLFLLSLPCPHTVSTSVLPLPFPSLLYPLKSSPLPLLPFPSSPFPPSPILFFLLLSFSSLLAVILPGRQATQGILPGCPYALHCPSGGNAVVF